MCLSYSYQHNIIIYQKGKNYSKKNKANSIAVKDTIRSNHLSKTTQKGNNKEFNHKKPFVLKSQNMEQEGSYEEWIKLIHNHVIEKYGEMAQELIRNEPIDDPEAIIRPHENANR